MPATGKWTQPGVPHIATTTKVAPSAVFRSRLPKLSIYQLERMSAAALQRREAAEQRERELWAEAQRTRPKPARHQ